MNDFEYDYRDPADCRGLAARLHAVPANNEAYVAAWISDRDLMRHSQWWVRLMFRLLHWRHGSTYAAWQVLEQHKPGTCREWIEGTARWVITGRDRTTQDAAGGFNQHEMDTLAQFLLVFG